MTALQSKKISDTMTAFLKAEMDTVAADAVLAKADDALTAAQTDLQVGAPMRAKKVIDDATTAYFAASDDRQTKFQADIDSRAITNQAQADFNDAIVASRQTSVLEAV